ncbi:helix-turn-helix domain-containing protein [Amycolatopsis thermophila]|uniref:Transcriptional regulator with XRE-family HTH domain n=1 Tax=Amycolatopsis thermophila TaxID=206084 RepID=A0ABU0EMY0_9PSEU|nr:helix-turn-helix transcriptional regulator [Amycolatopsis thermophila]MDQ0376634.1 transcriptional regulator with XRE-family HTH domain [Amycolatopsis thermophila]
MGDNTTLNWQNLDDELDRRRNELNMTWGDVADKAGLSETMLRKVRRGQSTRPTPRTKAAIEKAVSWETGSFDAVLRNEPPTPKGDTPGARGTHLAAVPTARSATATSASEPAATATPAQDVPEDAERELFDRWRSRVGERFSHDWFWELVEDFTTVRKMAIQGSRTDRK